MSLKIELPKVQARRVEKYELKDLKKEFSIPDFQRKASSAHIRGMINSILSNKFYDIVIKYVVDSKGRKQVIDGQQRLEALYICNQKHGLQYYNLLFLIFEEKFARTVFRRLNMGKTLATRDHSKALDDGKNIFFNELQPWLAHERTPAKSSFVEMLHALNYVRGIQRPVNVRELDQVIDSINKKELSIMKIFSEACRIVSPVVFRAFIYKAIIYRNVFKIAFDNNLSKDQTINLLKLCDSSKKLKELSSERAHHELPYGYKIIHDELLPKVTK